jgi:LAGLIDADG endonuclease
MSNINGFEASIFYIIQYILTSLNIFYILIIYGYISKDIVSIYSPIMGYGKPLLWVLWPNSEDLLKLLVPNCSRKAATSGRTNHSCTVISQKMIERVMEYCGSKSKTKFIHELNFVKEQRVDGHRSVNLTFLRCTLMDFERNYQVRIPSNHLITLRRLYTSLPKSDNLNPWFLTGLADGEGSFCITIFRNKEYKLGWQVQAIFQIGLHTRDLALLLQVQQFFGGIGSIKTSKTTNMVIYSVSGIKDLINTILPHFVKYPLITQKRRDFLLFQKVVNLMNNKTHLTKEGLNQIVNIRASMNNGLSNELKTNFTNIIPITKPNIEIMNIPNENWIVGFVSGDGSFDVNIHNSKKNKTGYQVQLRFRISQHIKDKTLLSQFIKNFDCGSLYSNPKRTVIDYVVINFNNIDNIIIPFFKLYQIQGVKQLDFEDFCKVATLMKNSNHLTATGIEEIKKIKTKMNSYRNK